MLKKYLLMAMLAASSMPMSAAFQFEKNQWGFAYDNNRLDISYEGRTLFPNVVGNVVYNLTGDDTEYTIATRDISNPEITTEEVSDEFGNGTSIVFSYKDERAEMRQCFNIYDDHEYIIAVAMISSLEGERIESRHIVPFATASSGYPLEGTTSQRILWVPYDNDNHIHRYKSSAFGSTVKTPEGVLLETSSEVSAIYDPGSRRGIVIGSVDHDKWKSGITIEHKNGGRVPSIECLSGWTDYNLTKDILPHGKVKGNTVSSARYMIGQFDDWRNGMETFADANCLVVPRFEWTKGNPVGWNSWGNMLNYINYDGVLETAQYIDEKLRPLGFYGQDGKVTISLDSFNGNLGDVNLSKLGNKIFSDGTYRDGKETKQGINMNLGMYGGMVVWSWTLGSKMNGTGLNGTPDYTWGDVALKVNGKPYGHNGSEAYAMDPTHPAVRANLEYEFKKWASLGCKYVKMDFVNSSSREGDSWYDPEVTTGTMAYNYGMKIVRELAEKYDMYIVLAMSPLFPYQYAHGRRTCCDRWGRLEESEFVMNAISYGWWTDHLYTVNDPDQMTLCQNDHNMSEKLGENRVRATTGMTTGAFIFGDTFSDHCYYTEDTKDGKHKKGEVVGYPAESRKRALEIMGNRDINEYVRNNTGSFRPLEGGNPSSRQESESLFVRDTPQYLYLAAFNWQPLLSKKINVTFDRLGIEADNVGVIKELWSGEEVDPTDEGIEGFVDPGDVKVFRISKNDYSGIESISEDINDFANVELRDGVCKISSSKEMRGVSIFNLQGMQCQSYDCGGRYDCNFSTNLASGIYIVECRYADGTHSHVKLYNF